MTDIVNWPIAATVLGGIAIFAFRPALSRLIDRLKSASKEGGVQFDRPQDGASSVLPLKFVELMSLPLFRSAAIREKSIQEELQTLQISDPTQQVKVLTRSLAVTRLTLEFANISGLIFGSQLTLLDRLSALHQGIAVSEALEIFRLAQSQFAELHRHRTAEEWLGYLVAMQLVTASESSIAINQYGRDFLKY
ncbi:MAG: hypothetical protein NT013_02540, partial [Planctomycetia bacterium]|nr:hypothetical protein [Planctomycetia bacterium]